MRNGNIQTITELIKTMSQNMQSLNKQKKENVQHKINRDCPEMQVREKSRGKTAGSPRGTKRTDLHSDHVVLEIVWQGGWTA
jgi:hypothetical protein